MKPLILALQFLTRIPLPRVEASADDFARAMRWFPAAGLVVGAVVAGTTFVAGHIGPWQGALAGLAAWLIVTGGLHLDGLADLVDARGAAHGDKARFLEVLADPHIGSFGVMAIVLQMLAKLVLLHAAVLGQHWVALILIPFAARIAPLVWTHWLPPLHQGLAARFRHGVSLPVILVWALALAAAGWFVPALWAGFPLIAAGYYWFRTQLGGISGDCHGAGIELLETLLLIALIATRLG